MDPARSETPASNALSSTERDARIEQLLLTGLDHYFANDYEQAINLWTRVLFLDRNHDRARAYIDRARSAQAELQRESEALLHQGLEAFTRGDVETAREMLIDALERGAPRDLAIGVLDRIQRLGVKALPATGPRTRASWLTRRSAKPAEKVVPAPPRRGWAGATMLLVVAALGAVAVGLWGVTLPDLSAWIFASESRRAAPVAIAPVEPLPVPAATELFVARARTLKASGRLRDALRELDRVPIGDSERAAADRLRAEIQRHLLAVADADPRPTHEVP